MERVVYFLGAGFSAPLGLPVMSNFLEKSKDLYFSDPQQYKYFEDVLETIAKMSVVKNYYSTDLFNIEEILSILAMQQGLRGRRLKQGFLRYISDVINYYTPTFPPRKEDWPLTWHDGIFNSTGRPGRFFGALVGSILQLSVSATPKIINPLRVSRSQNPTVQYAVVTLNYDLILEGFVEYISGTFRDEGFLNFSRTPAGTSDKSGRGVPLIKLHGSADTGVIVAPTWNKNLAQNLLPAWKSAFEELAKANHIRIIGYSLPTTDAYIKYLLRAAAIESPHLKRIDVLCRDNREATVQARYREFIDFANFRFVNCDVVEYVEAIWRATFANMHLLGPTVEFDKLEPTHEEFFLEKAV